MNASPPAYTGNTFAMHLPEGWNDATVHVLNGPTVAGHPHSIVVQTLADVEADTLDDFAEPLVETAQQSLRQAALLMYDVISLAETPAPASESSPRARRPAAQPRPEDPRARRAILRWHPESAAQPHYQEQLFVLAGRTGYVLSASFTQQSRRAAGPAVERVMRSFRPGQ